MQNKPKLRFKEFNDEWREDKLCNLFLINAGGDIDSSHCSSEKTEKFCYPIYANALTNNGLYGYSDIYKVKGHTITVTGRGDVGHATPRKEPYYPIVRLLILRPQHNENVDFFASVINSTRIFLESTGVPQLTSPQLSKVKVSYPSTQEQNRIAEVLNKVDEVIAEREEEVKDLEQQKKGLMQKIFSQQLRFTDSNNNPYPDWEDKKIGDVFEFYNGKAHEQEIDENGEYIVVNSKFISTEGQVKKYTNKVICPLKKDDIVLVMSDVPNGKAMSKCYLIEEDNKYSLNQRICCLRTKDVARFFIYQISRNKYFLKFDNGVSQTNLRKEDVLKCPIQVPCLEEQQKIANVLSKLDELIEEKKALLSDWQSFKKGLLQQMFV